MNTEKNLFIRGHCQSCGAPIKKTRQRGKYLCQYCGTVYFDSSYNEGNWEEDKDDIDITLEKYTSVDSSPTSSSQKKQKISSKIILGLVLCTTVCLSILVINGLYKSPSNNNASSSKQIEKPTMLIALPAASQAGKTIPYKDWEILLDPQIEVHNNRVFFKLSVKNWSENVQVLRYTPNDMIVYDDLGNTYPIFIGNCAIDLPHLDRQISIMPYEQVSFKSDTSWCNREEFIPAFSGVIPLNANFLYFHINKFGVFENLTFMIKL